MMMIPTKETIDQSNVHAQRNNYQNNKAGKHSTIFTQSHVSKPTETNNNKTKEKAN